MSETTLQQATDALNAAATAYNGKIDEINQAQADFLASRQDIFIARQVVVATAGGTAVAGDNVRDFNTVVRPLEGISLSNGQFDIESGKYVVEGFCSFYRVGKCSIIIRNLSDGLDEVLSSSYAGTSEILNIGSRFKCFLDIASSKSFNIVNNVEVGKGSNGLGEGGLGGGNVFAGITIERVG